MINKSVRKSLIIFYLLLQTVMYYYIVFSHQPCNRDMMCLMATVINFCAVFIFIRKDKEWLFVFIALLFTVGADYFLTYIHANEDFAMVLFSITQLSYAVLIVVRTHNKTINIVSLIARLSLSVIMIVIAYFALNGFNILISISMFYFVNLVANIVFSFMTTRKNYFLSIGLFLFMCCDLCLGLAMVRDFLPLIDQGFIETYYVLLCEGIWFFYLPSQVLLVLNSAERFSTSYVKIQEQPQ